MSINRIALLFCQQIMIVQRQMSVITEELEPFRFALKQYVDMASSQDGCLQWVWCYSQGMEEYYRSLYYREIALWETLEITNEEHL